MQIQSTTKKFILSAACFVAAGCGPMEEPSLDEVAPPLARAEQQAQCETCPNDPPPPTGGGSTPLLKFWMGNNGMDAACGTIGASVRRDLYLPADDSLVTNDDARSMTLYSVKAGTRIILCDSKSEWVQTSGGYFVKAHDDMAIIEVLQDIGSRLIGSFELGINDGTVRQDYVPASQVDFTHFWQGLDGKVSIIRVFPPGYALPASSLDYCDI
jgi:hypothetical protein